MNLRIRFARVHFFTHKFKSWTFFSSTLISLASFSSSSSFWCRSNSSFCLRSAAILFQRPSIISSATNSLNRLSNLRFFPFRQVLAA